MNYDKMTKAELIEEIKKLKSMNIEKSGDMFFAFVTDDRAEHRDQISEIITKYTSFQGMANECKDNPVDFCLDLVYWNPEADAYCSPFGDNEWEHAVRIPNEMLKEYIEIMGNV